MQGQGLNIKWPLASWKCGQQQGHWDAGLRHKIHLCPHTFAWSWGAVCPQQKRKKEKPYLLGDNFFAVTSPSGSALNNQEQRSNQNIKLSGCFSQVNTSLAGRA